MKVFDLRNCKIVFDKFVRQPQIRLFHNPPKKNDTKLKNVENILSVINFITGVGFGFAIGLIVKRTKEPINKKVIERNIEITPSCPMKSRLSLAPLLSYSNPAIVAVRLLKNKILQIENSGFIFDPKGHIITVGIDPSKFDDVSIKTHDGRTFPVTLVEYDTSTGLALLKILSQTPLCLPSLNLSTERKFFSQNGDFVVSLGKSSSSNQNDFSLGILKKDLKRNGNSNFYQISEITSKKHLCAGGPVINLQGQLVGINASELDEATNNQIVIPIKFARFLLERNKTQNDNSIPIISSNQVKPLENEIENKVNLKSLQRESFFR